MSLNCPPRISLFDTYGLVIPPGLTFHTDGTPGQRVLFLSDKKESFVISFEEGMELIDMLPAEGLTEQSNHTARCCKDGKYIHLRRSVNGSYAFFHVELEDRDGGKACLPGQMTVRTGYPWSDGVEPILLELMDGLTVLSDGEQPSEEKTGGVDFVTASN